MSIWIITTGNSDVQLNTKERWTKLFRNVRSQLDSRGFTPAEGTDNRFVAPARVLGTVYSQPQAEDYWSDLAFPLLDNFIGQIQNEAIDKIILILTDQAAVFSPEARRSQHHPYWQDTCTLEPLLKTYLHSKFPKAELKPLLLHPESSTKGLDDWDSVLTLIQGKFSKLDFPGDSTIYVSHQAGTPAISSAVQFETLLRFGQRINFLVTSERDSKLTKILDRSTYLRGIRKQEAKALLDRHDYSGVKELLASSLNDEIKDLLDAAIQWNFAKFDDFAKAMEEAADKYAKDNEWWQTIDNLVKARSKEWWWTAYESAYLAVVRLKQGNTVEAMFHSFRAVEGLLRKWADEMHPPKEGQNPKKIQIICDGRTKTFNRYGKQLYDCLDNHFYNEHNRNIDSIQNEDIWKFGNITFDKRNDLFHQLLGMQEIQVFQDWGTQPQNQVAWEARVLGCLNFISGQSFTTPLEEASLMSQVHQELVNEIASYQP